MELRKQQIEIMHTMCQDELKTLQINLQKFLQESENSQKVLYDFILKDNNISNLIAFDRYMSQIVTVFIMARKFNTHLQISNLSQTDISESSSGSVGLVENGIKVNHILSDFIELNSSVYENKSVHLSDITPSKTNLEFEANPYVSSGPENYCAAYNTLIKFEEHKEDSESFQLLESTEKLLKFLLPPKSLDHIQINRELEAYVININNHQNLEFFICQKDDYKCFFELSLMNNFNHIPNQLLPQYDVFCVLENQENDINNFVWRAIKITEKEENNKCKDSVYLIDFGEIITLTDNCTAYEAPQHFKEIPPLAVKCKLEGIENTFSKIIEENREKCMQFLKKNVFKKLTFRVVKKKLKILHVVAIDFSKKSEEIVTIKCVNKFNPFLDYNEQYDHKDQVQTNFSLSTISPKVGDRIQVMVTHVISPASFYAIIHDDLLSECRDFSWHENQICPLQRRINPPQINDIVLSQYCKDYYFYRAKVVDVDHENNRYKVM